ncbi:MAG: PilZ domain-containing protein [Clostridium sp.]|uniref:flagellar brake protein n=1 Tax=Clostridium sp. TaxID=1506 RepID=UPI0025B8C451|nr:PilZ domain-containing protein [Clostridium sp.]MCE5220738.1 PilZ domain-containing protein [Clostridium sp.]
MDDINLKVNDKIEVVTGEKIYKALIIDVQDDFLRINLPVNDGEYLMVHINEKIEMNSFLDDGRCFKFYSKVISRGKEGNIIYYKISKPFDIKKIQRRNFFRVSLFDTINYKIITDIDKKEFDSISYKEAYMIDLSGGGLKIKVNDEIKKEDLLLIKIKIKGHEIELKCNIVRIESTENKEKLYGLKFLDITPVQTDIIIQGLFELVRKQRAKL